MKQAQATATKQTAKRQRGERRARVTTGSGGGDGGGSSWNQEWRTQVSHELESSAEKHQQAAVIQERIMGVLNQHDMRLLALEKRPESFRADLTSFGGCSSQLVYAGFTAFNTLLSVSAILYSVLHK